MTACDGSCWHAMAHDCMQRRMIACCASRGLGSRRPYDPHEVKDTNSGLRRSSREEISIKLADKPGRGLFPLRRGRALSGAPPHEASASLLQRKRAGPVLHLRILGVQQTEERHAFQVPPDEHAARDRIQYGEEYGEGDGDRVQPPARGRPFTLREATEWAGSSVRSRLVGFGRSAGGERNPQGPSAIRKDHPHGSELQ